MQLFFPIDPGDELPVSAFFGRKPLLAPEFGVTELLFKHVDAGLESGVLLLGTRVPFVRQVLIVGQRIHLFLQHLYLIVEVVNVFFDRRIGIHIIGCIANGTATGRIET
jgi:hypothetical protein